MYCVPFTLDTSFAVKPSNQLIINALNSITVYHCTNATSVEGGVSKITALGRETDIQKTRDEVHQLKLPHDDYTNYYQLLCL